MKAFVVADSQPLDAGSHICSIAASGASGGGSTVVVGTSQGALHRFRLVRGAAPAAAAGAWLELGASRSLSSKPIQAC